MFNFSPVSIHFRSLVSLQQPPPSITNRKWHESFKVGMRNTHQLIISHLGSEYIEHTDHLQMNMTLSTTCIFRHVFTFKIDFPLFHPAYNPSCVIQSLSFTYKWKIGDKVPDRHEIGMTPTRVFRNFESTPRNSQTIITWFRRYRQQNNYPYCH